MKLSINDERPLFGPQGETRSKCVTQSRKVKLKHTTAVKTDCDRHRAAHNYLLHTTVIKENVKISVNNSLVAKQLQKRFFK